MRKHDEVRRLRRTHYILMMIVATMLAGGRIATVINQDGNAAFFSANDRSRWATVSALVEDGSFQIDRHQTIKDRKGRRVWQTIDRVQHRGADGKQHDYSSKPPLFPVMVAGVYYVVNLASGMTLTDYPIYVTRIVLALVNLPLLLVFFMATIFSIERVGYSDWARRFMATAVCFGTMLLPFSFALNNHLPAAAATAVVMYIYISMTQKLEDDFSGATVQPPQWIWVTAGACAGFAVANELPALSMLVFWGILFFFLDRRSVPGFVAGVAVVAVAFFGTNWMAHGSLRPAYAHRGVGAVVATMPAVDDAGRVAAITGRLRETSVIDQADRLLVEPSDEDGRWRITTTADQKFAVMSSDPGQSVDEASEWQIRAWDDWYEYPGSYWQGERQGVDKGEPNHAIYFAMATIGTYGLFSLTPLWILVPNGLWISRKVRQKDQRRLFLAVAVASLVCFTFYMLRPQIDRNYGGVSVCFRWMLWFAPLWLVAAVPWVDKLANTDGGRWLGIGLFSASVFSVATSLQTPWQSPWIYRYLDFLGWLGG